MPDPEGDVAMVVLADVVSSRVHALDECIARHRKLADWAIKVTK